MDFASRPLLDIRPNFINVRIGQLDDFVIQGRDGIATPWKPTSGLKRKLTIPFQFSTKAEWRALRDFFAARLGNLTGFWMPTWLTDYVSNSQVAGSTLVKISPIGLSDVFVADEQFAFLALIDRTQIEAHEIANITTNIDGDEELNLAATITGTFSTTSSVCCPLLFVRLSDDGFTTAWVTDQVAEVTLTLLELPKEYVTEHEGSHPIFLYEFTKGGVVWRTTNHHEGVVAGSEYWSPENISQGAIRNSLTMLASIGDLSIRTDSSDHPLRSYVRKETVERTELNIYRAELDTLTYDVTAPVFSGELGQAQFEQEGQMNFRLSSFYRIGEEAFPRKKIQRTCNHSFCDVNCTQLEATWEITGVLTGLTDEYVQADEFLDEAVLRSDSQWFSLGKVRLNGEVRQVMGQVTDKLYINLPFTAGTLGDDIVALPGCNKRPSHCETRYTNITNSVMMALIPNTNPQYEALKVPKSGGGKKG